jgi:hypothetical protein
VLVYREVFQGRNILRRLVTNDGVTWGPAEQIIDSPNHQLISPALVARDGHHPLMWVVDAGIGCSSPTTQVVARRWLGPPDMSAIIPGQTWSNPIVTNLRQFGYIIWHMDVTYIASRRAYWAIYAARPTTTKSCTADNNLFLARSRDGVHWVTWDKPVLTTGVTPWASATLYRSSMVFDSASNTLRVWLSASATGGAWYLGYAEVPIPGSPSSNIVGASLSRSALPLGPVPQPSLRLRTDQQPLRAVKDSFP